MAILLETRIASASVSEGCGSSSVMVRPRTRHLPPSPDTWSVDDTRRSDSKAAAAKIFAREPGSNVSVNALGRVHRDRKSTRLNSSHLVISYAVFCLKKKKHKNHLLTANTASSKRLYSPST